jgi:hypothetical protein
MADRRLTCGAGLWVGDPWAGGGRGCGWGAYITSEIHAVASGAVYLRCAGGRPDLAGNGPAARSARVTTPSSRHPPCWSHPGWWLPQPPLMNPHRVTRLTTPHPTIVACAGFGVPSARLPVRRWCRVPLPTIPALRVAQHCCPRESNMVFASVVPTCVGKGEGSALLSAPLAPRTGASGVGRVPCEPPRYTCVVDSFYSAQ